MDSNHNFDWFLHYSCLPLIADFRVYLQVLIRAFNSYFKHYSATNCNNRQKSLCGIVRLCGVCALADSGPNLCGIVRGRSFHRRAVETPRVGQMCATAGLFCETRRVGFRLAIMAPQAGSGIARLRPADAGRPPSTRLCVWARPRWSIQCPAASRLARRESADSGIPPPHRRHPAGR